MMVTSINPFLPTMQWLIGHDVFVGLCGLLFAVLTGYAHADGAPAPTYVRDETGPRLVYERSEALLISASNYQNWPNLPSVQSEIDRVGGALQEQGFSIEVSRNPSGRSLYNTVNAFLGKSRPRATRIILYFSGHGWSDAKGDGYFLGVDAPTPDAPGFRDHALSLSVLRSLAASSTALHTLVVLDSCYSGSIFGSRGNIEVPPLWLESIQKGAIEFLSSGSSIQRVPGKSSFAPLFISGISGAADLDSDHIVQVRELALYLQHELPRVSNQTPQYGPISDAGGDMIFTPRETRVYAIGFDGPASSPIAQPQPANPLPPVLTTGLASDRPDLSSGFRTRFPSTEVYYYRKSADQLRVLDALNRSDIPFQVRPAELAQSTETNAVGCGKTTDIEAVKTVAKSMLRAGVPIKTIYTYSGQELKKGRIQLNAYPSLDARRVLSEDDIDALLGCPSMLTRN